MTPDEIHEVTTAVAEVWANLSTTAPENSKDYLYVIGSIVPTLILLGRWFKKAFVKSMSEAVEKIVSKTMEPHAKEVAELKETVDEHGTFIDRLKEKC